MNLVEQIARLIDAEGAYGVGYPSTAADAKPHPFSTRQLYFQAKYELLATEIIGTLMRVNPDAMRRDLIDHEKAGWRRLGLPSVLYPKMDEQIEKKYPPVREVSR